MNFYAHRSFEKHKFPCFQKIITVRIKLNPPYTLEAFWPQFLGFSLVRFRIDFLHDFGSPFSHFGLPFWHHLALTNPLRRPSGAKRSTFNFELPSKQKLRVLASEGARGDPTRLPETCSKINAILNPEPPRDITQLRSFLGRRWAQDGHKLSKLRPRLAILAPG